MAIITCYEKSYTVDHAVKGADYVHGYSADGTLLISLDGINDFSVVTYDGIYVLPSECPEEACNDVKYCNGVFMKRDGVTITIPFTNLQGVASIAQGGTGSSNGATGLANLFAAGPTIISSWQAGPILPAEPTAGRLFLLELDE